MRWFTSDNHFGHAKCIGYCNRPFVDVDEMNCVMIERWNAVVGQDDEVWHLGDFSLSTKWAKLFRPLLKGKIHLIPGNHDFCHPVHGQSKSTRDYTRLGFIVEELSVRLMIAGKYVVASHMPYLYKTDDGHELRYPEYRPINKGLPLICGHVHEKWKTMGRMLNVGVDQWNFTPVAEDEIAQWLSTL